MSGQKGVVCRMLDDEKLPRTKDGVIPDLFINPHAFPKRQTVGFHLEVGLGLLAKKQKGRQMVANPGVWNVEKMLKALQDAGVESTPTFYTPRGDIIGKAFFGPMLYLGLKHQAEPKCRATNKNIL